MSGATRCSPSRSIRYGELLASSGLTPSTGTVGDSYAPAETINGLNKTELVKLHEPWRTADSTSTAATSHPPYSNTTTINTTKPHNPWDHLTKPSGHAGGFSEQSKAND